ncbi:hypothetical protein [Natrinema salaciae]|uniref:Uncharacterized protein n=1 Tax=Natrinema salaciae TaxID=1186196 RepID=A0A1H9SFT2_9EURY|nr:hypothetical protein [Natrinema salaciae]SER83758.1 hypothetical protein SAMN04489841_4711 [Natrinema salaciae]
MSFRQPSATFFAIVAGGYVGLVATGMTGFAIGSGYVTQWSVAIGACVGIVTAVRSYTWDAPATVLIRTRVSHFLFGVPLVPFFASPFLTLFGRRGYETAVTAWLGELLVIASAGVLFYLVTVNRHVASLRERERVLAEWTARPDTRYRRLLRGLGVSLGCVSIVGSFVLSLSFDIAINPFAGIGGAMIGQAITTGRCQTYTLFESGLCVRRSKTVNYQFVPRGQLRSVDLTDDRLEIRRGLPWPLPIRCATTTMARPTQVADTLTAVLDPVRRTSGTRDA